MLQTDIRRE